MTPLFHVLKREVKSIERVYRTRYVNFRNALASIAGGDDSAHDAVQDAFAQALAQRHQFRGGSLEAWIWRIALRAALKQRRDGWPVDGLDELELQLVEPERDPELAYALGLLPPRRRLIVFLHYFADLSYAEISEVCEGSEGTVAATLAQARASLRNTLDPKGVPQ